MAAVNLHGTGAWATAATYSCQRCGAYFEARNRIPPKWCRPCRLEIDRERARAAHKARKELMQ